MPGHPPNHLSGAGTLTALFFCWIPTFDATERTVMVPIPDNAGGIWVPDGQGGKRDFYELSIEER